MMKEKNTASSSCFGFLIGPVWASSVAWLCGSALMASSITGGSSGAFSNQPAIIERPFARAGN
ncbi:hypothetical protein D3C78_1937380 [compost metagenome]